MNGKNHDCSWKLVRTPDVLSGIITGKKDVNQASEKGDYPFFSCARETSLFSNAFLLDTNAIIIAGNGAYAGFIKKYSGRFDLYQRTYALFNFRENVNWKFVYYVFKYHFQRQFIGGTTGTAIPYITKPIITNFQFAIPEDLSIQDKIASILSAYDDLIEINRRQIELLEKAARLIYEEWFVRFRFPGHENTKIVDGVPAGWNLTHLSEIFSTQYGYTETATNKPVGPKFLRGTDINKTSYIDWSTVPFCPEDELDFDRYSLQVGDIVVIRMADPGKVAIVETAQKAIFASYLVRLKQKPEVNTPPLYLFYALAGSDYPGFISRASGGTTRKSANARLLVSFEILIPPENVAKLFVEMVNPMRQQIQTLLRQNGALRQARDLLLPRLIVGDIARTIK